MGQLEGRDPHIIVLGIASRVLARTDIKLDDNFFDVGGDSLGALELLVELQDHYDCEFPLELAFECGSLRDLAATIIGMAAKPPLP